jgi:hypothetical protein
MKNAPCLYGYVSLLLGEEEEEGLPTLSCYCHCNTCNCYVTR